MTIIKTTPPLNPRWQQLKHDPHQFELIRFRSDFLNEIRQFFLEQGFIEIDAPALVPAAGMEPHIEPFVTELHSKTVQDKQTCFLHTSPEFSMKKMLAAGCEKIFFLGHVFRNEELSSLHNPEFMMLEWYRANADYYALMKDCEDLVGYLKDRLGARWSSLWRNDGLLDRPFRMISLTDLMKTSCQVDLSEITPGNTSELINIAHAKGLREADESWCVDDLFFLLFLNFVEPNLGKHAPVIVKDYPVWMASLARRKKDEPDFVERFELYIDAVEIANAFSELIDPEEQYQRLVEEQKSRRRLGRTEIPIDTEFIQALESGIPPSAGIALGVDRLMMVCTDQKEISRVVPYLWPR